MNLPNFAGVYHTDPAIVIDKNNNNTIIVAISPRCTDSEGCKHCIACQDSKSTLKLTIKISPDQKFSIGQNIEIHRFVINEAISAGIILGLPIVLTILLAIWAILFNIVKADSPQLFFISAGGFIVGIAVAALFDKILKLILPPKITKT